MKTKVMAGFLAGAFITAPVGAAETNLWIGDDKVQGKMLDGKIVGDRFIVSGSDSIIVVHAEVAPFDVPPDALGVKSAFATNQPGLRLLMATGQGGWVGTGVNGFRGPVYIAADFPNPKVARTNIVEVFCSADKTHVVMLVLDNGPLYYSTNSGAAWTIFTAPGEYELPLTDAKQDGGFTAAATLLPRSNLAEKQQGELFKQHWYAVASQPQGGELVLTGGTSQSAPALAINHAGGQVILSWPSEFSGFVLQQNSGLNPAYWTDVTNSVQSVSRQNLVTLPSAAGHLFYRLKSP